MWPGWGRLDELSDELPFHPGRPAQYLAAYRVAYGKATRRRSQLAVTASIGPAALNLGPVAGLATLKGLLCCAARSNYATRHQGPVCRSSNTHRGPTPTSTSVRRCRGSLTGSLARRSLCHARPQAIEVLKPRSTHGAGRSSPAAGHSSRTTMTYGGVLRTAGLEDPPRPMPYPTRSAGSPHSFARRTAGADPPAGIHYSDAYSRARASSPRRRYPGPWRPSAGNGASREEWWQAVASAGRQLRWNSLVKQADCAQRPAHPATASPPDHSRCSGQRPRCSSSRPLTWWMPNRKPGWCGRKSRRRQPRAWRSSPSAGEHNTSAVWRTRHGRQADSGRRFRRPPPRWHTDCRVSP